LLGGFEETLNCRLEFPSAAAGNTPGGGPAHFFHCSACLRAARPAAILNGMPRFFYLAILVVALAAGLFAEDAIEGKFVGDWSGSSASGKFQLSVAREDGKPKCTVTFSFSGEDVTTNVTLCRTDGPKIEAQYDFDLSGNRLQSTIRGERKGNALAGTYQTKALEGGAQVDEGEWKAALAQ